MIGCETSVTIQYFPVIESQTKGIYPSGKAQVTVRR